MIATLKRRIDGWRYRRHYSFPTISLDDLVRGRQALILDLRDWDVDLRAGGFMDSLTIASISRALEPALYWEIGTGDGLTALLTARNTPDTSLICTLDPGFPEDAVKGSVFHGVPKPQKLDSLATTRSDSISRRGMARPGLCSWTATMSLSTY